MQFTFPKRRCKKSKVAMYRAVNIKTGKGKEVVSSKRRGFRSAWMKRRRLRKECRYSCIGFSWTDRPSSWYVPAVARWVLPRHSRRGWWWCRLRERGCGYGIDRVVGLIGGGGCVEWCRRRRQRLLGWLRGRVGARRDVLPRWHCACGGR